MFGYFIQRLVYVVPVALGVSVICFLLVHIAPGDPLTSIIGIDATAEQQAALRAAYGFDKPLPLQYFIWLGNTLQGNLGTSIATGRPVAGEVMRAIGNTFTLACAASLIGFTLGMFLGFIAGYFKDMMLDRAVTGLSIAGVSVPNYWLGIVLIAIFSVKLGWLPSVGAGPGGSSAWKWDIEHLRFIVLPAVTLAIVPMGIVSRTVRALVADALSQDFVGALAAKGLGHLAILRHVLRNVAPAMLSVVGIQLGYLLGGSILIETVFNWPGTGFLLSNAIFTRDLPLLQGAILVLALFFVTINLVVDLAQSLIDPRIRRG